MIRERTEILDPSCQTATTRKWEEGAEALLRNCFLKGVQALVSPFSPSILHFYRHFLHI